MQLQLQACACVRTQQVSNRNCYHAMTKSKPEFCYGPGPLFKMLYPYSNVIHCNIHKNSYKLLINILGLLWQYIYAKGMQRLHLSQNFF